MKHEIFDTVLNVTDSGVTFEKIYKKREIDKKKTHLLAMINLT